MGVLCLGKRPCIACSLLLRLLRFYRVYLACKAQKINDVGNYGWKYCLPFLLTIPFPFLFSKKFALYCKKGIRLQSAGYIVPAILSPKLHPLRKHYYFPLISYQGRTQVSPWTEWKGDFFSASTGNRKLQWRGKLMEGWLLATTIVLSTTPAAVLRPFEPFKVPEKRGVIYPWRVRLLGGSFQSGK